MCYDSCNIRYIPTAACEEAWAAEEAQAMREKTLAGQHPEKEEEEEEVSHENPSS